jgi:hypothetical protein
LLIIKSFGGMVMNTDYILSEIKKLKVSTDEKILKKYNIGLTERIVIRLKSFSDCEECSKYVDDIADSFKEFNGTFIIPVDKNYKKVINSTIKHFQKVHKLTPKGYYVSLGTALGVSIGLPFGVVFSRMLENNAFIGVGLPIGIGVGVAIGTNLDNKAKKEGLII